MKYYEVVAKCGHVGRNNCVFIHFACAAYDEKDAAYKVRFFPRVKHDQKDAIKSVREISFEEFMILKSQNDADPYLHCKNLQEQKKIPDFEIRVISDKRKIKEKKKRSHSCYLRTVYRDAECLADIKDFFRTGEVV